MQSAQSTAVERTSDLELTAKRTFNAPASKVFEAWTSPAMLKQWWVPGSFGMSLTSCEVEARAGGKYRFVFGGTPAGNMEFFGRYLEAIPNAKLVWTNEESADGAVTTVSFTERAGKTDLVFHERYPTTGARDQALEGMEACMPEQFAQLDALLAAGTEG